MILSFKHITGFTIVAAGLLSACKTIGPAEAKPALVAKTNQAVQDTFTLAVSKAVGSRVTLSPDSFTSRPSVTIEPPTVNKRNGQIIDGRSLERPTLVDLIIIGQDCFVVNRATGERYPLKGVSCKAISES